MEKTIDQNNKEDLALDVFYKIISKIQNGVDNGKGGIRKYDILDFFMTDEIEVRKLFEYLNGKVKFEEIKILKNFLKNNSAGEIINDYNIKDLFLVKVIRLLKDEHGNPIPGTEREIKSEEKQMALDFMKNHNLPMAAKIYSLIIDRYINGQLELDENKKMVSKV